MRDPTFARSLKLTSVAATLSIGLAAAGFVLPDTYRWSLWGAAAGLLASMLIFANSARRRASMSVALTRQANEKKRKRTVTWSVVATIAASVIVALVRLVLADTAQMVLLGAALGVLASFGLVLGPLFYKAPPRDT
jgi:Flp pilus assembly protein TadB